VRILLTSSVFLPDFCGGTETLVHGVALTLQRHGHAVVVVTGYPPAAEQDSGGGFDRYAVESIRVVRYRSAGRRRRGNAMRSQYIDPAFEGGFRGLLEEFKPDIVHFHHLQRLSVTAVDVCRQQRIPAFLTVTDYWYVCPTQTLLLENGQVCGGPALDAANCLKHIATLNHRTDWPARALERLPASVVGAGMASLKMMPMNLSGRLGEAQALAQRRETIADRLSTLECILVPARFTQDVMERNGIAASRFRVLPFAVGSEGYKRRVRERTGGALVLGFIGSLSPHKGVHVLVAAMRRLPPGADVRLKIYGSAPVEAAQYATELNAIAAEDSRIAFCGTFESRDLAQVLDGIDVLVVPSLWNENMPLVALSAQAAGCPLVASDIGGLADVVTHGRNGLVFPPGSAGELAELIVRLVDGDLVARLSREAVSPDDFEHYVGELEAEYRAACGR